MVGKRKSKKEKQKKREKKREEEIAEEEEEEKKRNTYTVQTIKLVAAGVLWWCCLGFYLCIYFTDFSLVEEIGKAVTEFYRLYKYVVSIFFTEAGDSPKGCYFANDSHIKRRKGVKAYKTGDLNNDFPIFWRRKNKQTNKETNKQTRLGVKVIQFYLFIYLMKCMRLGLAWERTL